jgi:hypothetical protein
MLLIQQEDIKRTSALVKKRISSFLTHKLTHVFYKICKNVLIDQLYLQWTSAMNI